MASLQAKTGSDGPPPSEPFLCIERPARARHCRHWTRFNQTGGEAFRPGARNHCGIVGAQGRRRHEQGEIFSFHRLRQTVAQIKIGGNPARHDQAERVAGAAIALVIELAIDLAEAAHGMAGLRDQTVADRRFE